MDTPLPVLKEWKIAMDLSVATHTISIALKVAILSMNGTTVKRDITNLFAMKSLCMRHNAQSR